MAINNKDKTVQKFYTNHLEIGTGRSAKFYQDDPTVLGFNVFFYFSDSPGSAGATFSPLFNEDSSRDSAINYLDAVGEPQKAEQLREFKSRLRELVQEYPYYFQNITGMESVMLAPTSNPYRMEETELTFEMLESIDLKVSSLVNLYRDSVYDYEFMRYRVPDNLLEFHVAILVSEIRNIRTFVGEVFDDGRPKFQLLDENMNLHKYQFGKCKFIFDNSNNWLETLDNKGGENASNTFKIKPGYLKEAHNLKFHEMFNTNSENVRQNNSNTPNIAPNIPKRTDSSTVELPRAERSDDNFKGTIKNRADGLKNITKDFFEREKDFFRTKIDLNTLGNRVINSAFDVVENKLQSFVLGNVFSDYKQFRNADIFDSTKDFVENKLFGNADNSSPTRGQIPLGLNDPKILDNGVLGDIIDVNRSEFPEIDSLGALARVEQSQKPNNLGDIIDEERSQKPNNLGDIIDEERSQKPDDLGVKPTAQPSDGVLDLGNKPIPDKSINANNLGDIIDEERSQKPDDLGVKPTANKGGITNNLGGASVVNERSQTPPQNEPIELGISPLEAKVLGEIANIEKVPFNFTEAALGSVKGFGDAPYSTMLNQILAGALGRITNC